MRIILISIGILIIVFITITAFFGFCSRHFNENGLKQIIKKKASLKLENKIIIKKYENTGAAISDFAEMYQIELIPEEYSKVLKQVQDAGKQGGWEKIERGYQLTLPQKTDKDTVFVFLLDEKTKKLKVQIIEE